MDIGFYVWEEVEESNGGPFNLGIAKQHLFNDFHVLTRVVVNNCCNFNIFEINESLNSLFCAFLWLSCVFSWMWNVLMVGVPTIFRYGYYFMVHLLAYF